MTLHQSLKGRNLYWGVETQEVERSIPLRYLLYPPGSPYPVKKRATNSSFFSTTESTGESKWWPGTKTLPRFSYFVIVEDGISCKGPLGVLEEQFVLPLYRDVGGRRREVGCGDFEGFAERRDQAELPVLPGNL